MKTLKQIRDEIAIWADRNFKIHLPALGLLEEIGEAAHIILKAKQGIRGYDDPHKRKVDLIDAIADAAIYGLHYAGINDIDPPTKLEDRRLETDDLFSHLAYAAGAILSGDKSLAKNNFPILFDILNTMAVNENVNLLDLVNDTWDRVSKRDWTKNPTDAHTEADKLHASSSSSSSSSAPETSNPDKNS